MNFCNTCQKETSPGKFCPDCGTPRQKIDAYVYINKCKCCGDDVESICKVCGSYPTPMTQKEFKQHYEEMMAELNKVQKIELQLDIKSKAMYRIECKKRGINCHCTRGMICSYHGSFYD